MDLLEAAQKDHFEVVRLLLDRGADVNQASQYSNTALMSATQKDHFEIVRLLEYHIFLSQNEWNEELHDQFLPETRKEIISTLSLNRNEDFPLSYDVMNIVRSFLP